MRRTMVAIAVLLVAATSGLMSFNKKAIHNMKTTTAIPIFQVSDVEASLKHYTRIFGFSEDFRFGDYAGIKLGDVRLHLSGHSVHERPVGGGTAHILCDEVDDYWAKIKKNGAIVKSDPKDYPYGMRDFMAVDPDGNHLAFGCEAKKI